MSTGEDVYVDSDCVCVSSGPPLGQRVSAPAASLSQAVINTYQSGRPVREDTGTHNPHSGSSTFYHSTLLCLAIVFLWRTARQELQSQQSACFSSELLQLQQRGFEASRDTARPGEGQLSNCRVCSTSAPNSTM